LIVVRDVGASVRVSTTVVPSPLRYVIAIGASTPFGLAIRMSVSKNAPVAPSAIV
jgi:trans-2-enoyl-CoA reductase